MPAFMIEYTMSNIEIMPNEEKNSQIKAKLVLLNHFKHNAKYKENSPLFKSFKNCYLDYEDHKVE